MRLWHKDLIAVLPKQQLLGQWRECCCIARNIAVNGTPNHLLVNKIMDYPIQHFVTYAEYVKAELMLRGYKVDGSCFTKWIHGSTGIHYDELFDDWHNDRYFNQCYYNLQEKYECGGITEDDWKVIEEWKRKEKHM